MPKTGFKIYFFLRHSKKAKKWPNGQIIFFWQIVSKKAKKWPNGQIIIFLANRFKKGQMATMRLTLLTFVFKVINSFLSFKLCPKFPRDCFKQMFFCICYFGNNCKKFHSFYLPKSPIYFFLFLSAFHYLFFNNCRKSYILYFEKD